MSLCPTPGRLIIENLKTEEITKSGIVLAVNKDNKIKPGIGRVVTISKADTAGFYQPGMTVYFDQWKAHVINDDFLVIDFNDIRAYEQPAT